MESLTSFLCPCGTPLAALAGTKSVNCHACGIVVGVPAMAAAPPLSYPPPPVSYPPPPAPAPVAPAVAPVPPGPRTFAAIAAIASAGLFVAYLALGMQILGVFGHVAVIDPNVGGMVTIAGVIGTLIAIGGLYESLLAFRCRTVPLIACGVFHLLAAGVLLSSHDRSGLGSLIVGLLGGPLGSVKSIGTAALVVAGGCIAAGIVVARARRPPARAGDASRPDRRWVWIGAGVGALALVAFAVIGTSGGTARATVSLKQGLKQTSAPMREKKDERKPDYQASGVLGSWAGSESQDGGASTYPVELSISDLEGTCGRFNLPSLGCSGELLCTSHDGDRQLVMRMRITAGISNCVEGNITFAAAGTSASFRWQGLWAGQYPDGVGTLYRR